MDSAHVFAAASTWLSRQISPLFLDGSEAPQARDRVNAAAVDLAASLVAHLLTVAKTDEMKEKLEIIRGRLFQLEEVQSWRSMFKSDDWSRLLEVHSLITHKGHASYGVEAVAAALLAFCCNLAAGPKQAVVVSASFAGSSASVVAQLTGGLSGSLFGQQWIPDEWMDNLERGDVEETTSLARAISQMRA